MKNVEKIKEAIMQDLLEKFGLLIDECAAQEKRIFDLEEKVAALSSQVKKKRRDSNSEYLSLVPATSTFNEIDFTHDRILKLKKLDTDSPADYAIVVVKRFFPTDHKLECYAFYVHEKSGVDKLYIADEQAINAYSKPSQGFIYSIAPHVGLDMDQDWKIAGGLMAFDEVQKLFQMAESVGYKADHSITTSSVPSGCTRMAVHEACVYSSFERVKKKNNRHGRHKK